ncbi:MULTISPECIES: DUF1778 domain-containing protein [Photorhabdus]|uniref:DUF1778 domain-containing protein n=1 Tax=Photorhabdus thracensis TaxID=230089 RepID=A0A0F7LTI4_9GAMM|nr:DUF1778 domain-containing protein [Photorhabdus thracensis]AKH65216.1 hypothetical protein VY86_19530 [Photorhabdus thracensis]MCC8421054.1 DUF1778 domain-containing protein [Photorhabdus thracensis]
MSEFINLQLKISAKKTLERAASFEGRTVSNFILTSALAHAEKTTTTNWQPHWLNIINVSATNDQLFKTDYRTARIRAMVWVACYCPSSIWHV